VDCEKIMWIPVYLLVSCTKTLPVGETISAKRLETSPGSRPVLPQPKLAEICILNTNYFYVYVWKLVNGPTESYPYFATDLRDARVTFTDGSFILCHKTVISNDGSVGQGGVGLQDISSQSDKSAGF